MTAIARAQILCGAFPESSLRCSRAKSGLPGWPSGGNQRAFRKPDHNLLQKILLKTIGFSGEFSVFQ
jgi:hypothetical protein